MGGDRLDADRVELAHRMRSEGKSYDYIAAVLRAGASIVKRALRQVEHVLPCLSRQQGPD